MPTVDAMLDADLVARWERLKGVRDVVNVALEAKRKDKTIGTSLGARRHAAGRRRDGRAARAASRRAADAVHRVAGRADRPTRGADAALEVAVARAEGEKCARCWRVVDGISADAGTEGLCERCVGAVAATA